MDHTAASDDQRRESGRQNGDGDPTTDSTLRGPVDPPESHSHGADHLAHVYRDRDQQLAAAIPFVQRGLEQGERCLYVADENSREAVLDAMRGHGIDVDAALESGTLSVHTKADTYLRTGEFDRDAMLDFWERTLTEAKEDGGYDGIRAVAEMSWALDEDTSLDLLAEYEAVLNDLYEDEDYAVLCQYNRDRFPAETIRDVIRTHPYLIRSNRVSHNTFYTSPEEFFDADRSVEVDRMIQTVHERTAAKAELAEREEYFQQVFERSHDAILIFDPAADEIIDANPAACTMLGYSREELLTCALSDIHPDQLDRFQSFVARAYEDGTGWTDELTCRTKNGERLPAEVAVSRIRHGDRPIVLAAIRDISTRKEHERYQQRLYEIAADADRSFHEKLHDLFALGCERFDMELGGMARIDPETDTFEVETVSDEHRHLRPGARVSLSETYCRVLDDPDETVGITDPADEGLDEMTAYSEFGVRSYLGTRLPIDGDHDRSLFFVSSEPRDAAFSEDERTFHHLLGQWVQYELERRRKTDQLAAVNNLNEVIRDINHALAQQSTRDEIERVVCERLAASDSYEFAWVGTVDEQTREVVPSTAVDVQNYLEGVTVTADDSVTGRGPAGTALRTGEPQFVQNPAEQLEHESWRKSADDRGVGAIASIPVAYETCYGVLNVYTTRETGFEGEEREVVSQLGEIMGLAIAAVEREQQLRHERERLEFINRLIRHNLLNSLNVVQARADILGDQVDPGAEPHLGTVRERTDEMIDLIETLRSLMRAVVEEDLDLEPVDLGAVLRDEIEHGRQAFDDAVFEVNADLDAVPSVMADDLVGEIFENLLTNAVQHNDEETPRVTIDARANSESVTVSVADNGPGVPAEMKDRIFEKGTKGFESPGTGFGLHLVREIVDMYGGEITVEDDEPSGAVFSVTLPRASAT